MVAPPPPPLLSLISIHPPVLTPYPLLDDALVTSLPTLPLPPYQSRCLSPDPQPSPSPLRLTSGAINTLFGEAQLGLFESPVVFITLKAFFGTARSESKPRMEDEDGH